MKGLATKSVAILLLVLSFFCSSAHAGSVEDQIFSLTNGIKSRYLADSGDLKLLALDLEGKFGEIFGDSSKCNKRRARDLSRAYRAVLDATASADAPAIYSAAKNLNHQAHHRSKMFSKCWRHMKKRASQLGDVGAIAIKVAQVGDAAGWQWK